MTRKSLFALLAVFMLLPRLAGAQAISAGTSVADALPGQVFQPFITDAQPNKWIRYQLRAGRSYCAEVAAVSFATEDTTPASRDPFVTVFAADGTTVITSSDDTGAEPDSLRASRACFIANANADFFMVVRRFVGGTSRSFNARLVETSLWASWFFIGGDYNAFTLLRNTTTTTISYTMTWRNPAGTAVGTTSGTVPPNGGIGINARTFVTNQAVNFNGTVEVVHTASPEGLVGQVTSLSATTGLGFDSTLFQRKPW